MPAFSNTRSTTIDASPEAIHALINDFREWQGWSPWEGLDPDLQRTYTGPATGLGSHYAWSGNSKAGTGTMEITHSSADKVTIDLEFLKPFKASNIAEFTLTPQGPGSTKVDWNMRGTRNLAMAVMGALYFDKAIAKDFDKGLAALKRLAEQD